MNHVAPLRSLEGETLRWCRRIMQNSPTAIACLKAALNADEDGAAGCVSCVMHALFCCWICLIVWAMRSDKPGA